MTRGGASSLRLEAGGISWHVTMRGQGPVLLLLHGTGASSASWTDLLPLLSDRFTLVAPDLPGHGATGPAPRGQASLPAIARAIRALSEALRLPPEYVVGHSAGAAISARLAMSELSSIRRLAWIGAAMKPFDGMAGVVAPRLARLLCSVPFVPQLAAQRARSGPAVRRVLESTGSELDARGIARYRALLAEPSHVAGTLALLADWDLSPLARELPGLAQPVLLLHGRRDRAVPLRDAEALAARLAHARLTALETGHLAHEEQPAEVAQLLASWFLSPDPAPARPA